MLTYRRASLQDVDAVYRLICDMEQKELPKERFQEIFLWQLDREGYYCLLCLKDGAVAGALNLRFEWQLHHGERIAEILEFAVDPACRNQGIGREMLARACRLAAEAGCTQIEVDCNQLRTDTHRFYQREGMRAFHYKFSRRLDGAGGTENAIGR